MSSLFDHVPHKHDRGHVIRRNTREANATVDHSGRADEVCCALRQIGKAATDRQICTALYSVDMNYVRPTITMLIEGGTLREVEHVKCEVTGRRVRTVWFNGASYPPT